MILNFYHEMKNEIRNDAQIIYLAKNLNLEEYYREVDALTIAIFHNHKAAFHILINRGINPNPPIFKDIPPLLWTLELSTTYYFEQILKRTKVNMFHIESKHGENLLANMCLKLDNMCLFRKTIRMMHQKNADALKKLIIIKVLVDMKRIYPPEICIHKLNKKITNVSSKKEEIICFEKIKILIDFYQDVKLIPLRILDCILNYPGILENNTCFLQMLFEYLHLKINLYNFQSHLHSLLENSICLHANMMAKLIIPYLNVYKNNDFSCIDTAIETGNIEIVIEFLKQGFDIGNIKNPYGLIELAIKKDNIYLYQKITSRFELKYKIWPFKTKLFLHTGNMELPKYHRALHMACVYQAADITKYLQDKVGDSLLYDGMCAISPYELLRKGVENYHISDLYMNQIMAPTIQYTDFIRKDTLKQQECAICLDDFYNNEVVMLDCGHCFHKCCLQKHIKTSNQCPYCRAEIIYKYKSKAKLALTLPKKHKKNYTHSHNYMKIKNSYSIKQYSNTYEDRDKFHVLVGKEMAIFEKQLQISKHQYFRKQIGIIEKNITINNLRFLLKIKRIGMAQVDNKNIIAYNSNYKNSYKVPPNSPIFPDKNELSPEDLLLKYDVDINKIMTTKQNKGNHMSIFC